VRNARSSDAVIDERGSTRAVSPGTALPTHRPIDRSRLARLHRASTWAALEDQLRIAPSNCEPCLFERIRFSSAASVSTFVGGRPVVDVYRAPSPWHQLTYVWVLETHRCLPRYRRRFTAQLVYDGKFCRSKRFIAKIESNLACLRKPTERTGGRVGGWADACV